MNPDEHDLEVQISIDEQERVTSERGQAAKKENTPSGSTPGQASDPCARQADCQRASLEAQIEELSAENERLRVGDHKQIVELREAIERHRNAAGRHSLVHPGETVWHTWDLDLYEATLSMDKA